MFKKDEINAMLKKIKCLSRTSMLKGNWNEALSRIELAARIAYTFNQIFTDVDLEEMLNTLSKKIILNQQDFTPNKNRFVFYDSFGFSNRGLVHQYIRALISWNVEFLYVCGKSNKNRAEIIINEIKSYSKAKIFIINNFIPKTDQIKILYDEISKYKPEKAFLYLRPWDVVPVTTFCALPNINRYQINLTDHAFWLGVSCTDYTIEFRNFGCTVSAQKRGLTKDKILLQPFYPIIIPSVFKGFPKEVTSDKVVIFSGGAYYKIYGENDKFFFLLKHILDDNSNAVILFAGWGEDKPIKRFIKENKYENRLFLLGLRSDINEVFAHCDIYLGTYPMSGGLMTQYAAIIGKPILAYSSSLISGGKEEELVLHKNDKNELIVTHSDLEDFFKEANKLIENKSYREKAGQSLKDCIITPEQFNSELYHLVTTHNNMRKINDVDINYQKHSDQYFEIENKYQNSIALILFSNLKLSAIWFFPKIALKSFPNIIIKYRKQIFNTIIKVINK